MAHDAASETLLRKELMLVAGVAKHASARRRLLYQQDGPADSLYFLESGLVKLFRRSAGPRPIILRVVTPGELFGEDAAGQNGTHSNSAEVMAEACIYAIPKASFFSYCEGSPDGWRLLSELLLERNRQLEARMEMLGVRDVERRIVQVLGNLAGKLKRPHTKEVAIPLSQGDLASLIGATRETTSTMLNHLQRCGLIRLGRRLLTVPSIENIRGASG